MRLFEHAGIRPTGRERFEAELFDEKPALCCQLRIVARYYHRQRRCSVARSHAGKREGKNVCRTDYAVAGVLTRLLYIGEPARHINGRREEERLIFEWHFRPSISSVLSLKLTSRWIYMDMARGDRRSVSGSVETSVETVSAIETGRSCPP